MTPLGQEPCPHGTGTSWGCAAAPAPCSHPCSYPWCRCGTWHRHLACSSDAGGGFGQSSSRIRARGKNGLRVGLDGWGARRASSACHHQRGSAGGTTLLVSAPQKWGCSSPCSWAAPGSSEHLGCAREARGKESARRWSSTGRLRARCQRRGETPQEVLRQGTATAGSQAGAAGGQEPGRRMDGRTDSCHHGLRSHGLAGAGLRGRL